MLKISSKALTRNRVNELIKKYPLDNIIKPDTKPWASQYDERSAQINYAFVRHFKPRVVVEFGTRSGRCTHDILKALLKNGGDYVYKPYEIQSGARMATIGNLERVFGDKTPEIGEDITKAKNIPEGIEYLFIDNDHDGPTTKWVFDELLTKCVPGALVHFHDISVEGDYIFHHNGWNEMPYMEELVKENKFPLEKVYWTYEEGNGGSSTWFQYKP